MVLVIDNYDSFTYNLVQCIGDIETEYTVCRNDRITIDEIKHLAPTHIVISPGPGYPKDAGVSEAVIREFADKIPILGVCLGHQAICEVYGAEITQAEKLMHGKQSVLEIDQTDPLFQGIEDAVCAARYHSLAAKPSSIPKELAVIAEDTENHEVMAVRHRLYPVYGVQFHPESILTPQGVRMIRNFLKIQS